MIRRIGLLIVVIVLLLGVSTAATGAQGSEPTTTPEVQPSVTPMPSELAPELFAWYPPGGPPNYGLGLLFFVVGGVGALVTVYLFLGEFLPSMGGKGEYIKLQAQLEYFEDRRKQLLDNRWQALKDKTELAQHQVQLLMATDRLSDDLDSIVKDLQRQMTSERWRLFILGFPLYVVLGGFFALAFARDVFQALLIGFGWTAVADRFGLSREETVRREFRDKQIEELRQQAAGVEPLTQELEKLRTVARTAAEFSRGVQDQAAQIQARLDATQDLLAGLQSLPVGPEGQAVLVQLADSINYVKQVVSTLKQVGGGG
jgi:hypothetical protein